MWKTLKLPDIVESFGLRYDDHRKINILFSLELHTMNTVAYCILSYIITDCDPCWSLPAEQLMLTLEIKKDECFIWAPRWLVLTILCYKKAMTSLWTLGYFAYRKFTSTRKSDSDMNPLSVKWSILFKEWFVVTRSNVIVEQSGRFLVTLVSSLCMKTLQMLLFYMLWPQ